ncbi:MAG: DUF2964 family protein [Verrucomicrobia bacterium]|nr:DUF2964 family protein [Verrucomicrobiota bacterium]
MTKRVILATVAVFIAWSILDFVIHGLLCQPMYEATANLWRPMAEMKMGLMHVTLILAALAFTGLYAAVASPKNVGTGVKYGLIFGFSSGLSMGLGTYCVMPIPLSLALVWFVGTIIEMTVAGVIIGSIVRVRPSEGGE